MIIRFDVKYLQNLAYCKEFPCAPATLFQAVVAANAHRLDEIADLLEVIESGKCVRIVNTQPIDRVSLSTFVPRLEKLTDIKRKGIYSKLHKNETIFVLDDAPVHASYYFEIQQIPAERLELLTCHTLGRGRSRCISSVTAVHSLPAESSSTLVWEPVPNGGRRMSVAYSGFLSNLRLYHSLKKSSSEVQQVKQSFSTTKSRCRYIMLKLQDANGEPFSWPQERTAELAGMLRHAVIAKMNTSELKEYASGHNAERVSYLPLPTLGKYTDGRIRRAIIVEKSGSALGLPAVRLSELNLHDNAGNYVATAVRVLKSDGVFDQYLTESKRWVTVTPSVLPGHDDGETEKRHRLITKMFEHAELPTPVSVTELQGHRIKANARHGHDKYNQVRLAVEFSRAITGAVVLGTGRHYGVGLCANLEGSATAQRFA